MRLGPLRAAEPAGADGRVSLAVWLQGWEELHGLAPTFLVRRWLTLVYRLGVPLARARLPPDLVTLASLVAAGGVLIAPRWAAVLLVLLSALLDGLDGCVAVLQGRHSRRGAVLDSVVDRCCDALFVLAMVRIGGAAGVGAGCGFGVLLLEYVRARAGQVASPVPVPVRVTVAERPTRVLVTVFALALDQGTAGLAVLTALTAVGLVQLLADLRPARSGR